MKKGLVVSALSMALLLNGGCLGSWFSSSKEEPSAPAQKTEQAAPAVQEPAPLPEPPAPKGKAAKKAKKGKKGQKTAAAPVVKGTVESLDVASQKLQDVGKILVRKAAATVTPSITKKDVVKEGKEYVARYVTVDQGSLKTEARPSTSPGSHYIGFIRYVEQVYECRGKTRKEALDAPCAISKSRRLNEIIRYEYRWIY